MLVVVVLVPIVLMVMACLLERFEAHTTHVRPSARTRRPVPGTATTDGSAAPPLALVPGDGTPDVHEPATPEPATPEPATPEPGLTAAVLDADTLRLPKAS